MLTCREMTDFLADYLDGRLPPDEAAAFARHLRVCPNCVRFLENYRRVTEWTRTAFLPAADEPAAPLPRELVAAILAARDQS